MTTLPDPPTEPTVDLVAFLIRAADLDPAAVEAAAVATILDAVLPPGKSLVWRLAARDGWECHYCACLLGWGNDVVTPPHVEHRVPKCRGGSDHPTNLVLSCGPCNLSKGTRTDVEVLARRWCEEDAAGTFDPTFSGLACDWPRITYEERVASLSELTAEDGAGSPHGSPRDPALALAICPPNDRTRRRGPRSDLTLGR